MSDSSAHLTHITSVLLPVADQDAAIAFYTEVLGFEKRADVPFGDGDRWVEVAPAGGETAIALVPPREGWKPGESSAAVGFYSTDIDATHALLVERGTSVDGEVMRAGAPVPPLFFLRDPDQNMLLVVGAV